MRIHGDIFENGKPFPSEFALGAPGGFCGNRNPVSYTHLSEFVPGPDCLKPLSPFDADFRRCHQPVGEFPEVDLGPKRLGVRLFTAFGAGLSPIL